MHHPGTTAWVLWGFKASHQLSHGSLPLSMQLFEKTKNSALCLSEQWPRWQRAMRGGVSSLPRSLSAGWLFHASGILSLRAFRTNWLLINLQMLKMLKVTWGWMMEKYSSNRIFWVWSPGTYFWIFTPACLTLSYPQRTDVRPGNRKQPAPRTSPWKYHSVSSLTH